MSKSSTKKKATKKKRSYTQNLTTVMPAVVCPHCKHSHDSKSIKVVNVYPNGNRRHFCESCSRPFVSIRNRIAE